MTKPNGALLGIWPIKTHVVTKSRRTGTAVLLFTALLLGMAVIPGPTRALAQATSPKERSLALVAEQAFASLDYTTAYRSGLQVLTLNPRNLAIRRLTAASALQLKRFSDCLRLITVIPEKETSQDDLHTTGECAQGLGNFAPALKRDFEKMRGSSDTADAANYWLGVAAYRSGDYAAAKSSLEAVIVLPARFESQKRFMLERIADYESAKASPAKPPPAAGTNSSSGPSLGNKTQQNRPEGRIEGQDRRPARDQVSGKDRLELVPRKAPENGWYSLFEGESTLGVAGGALDRVSLAPDAQKAFDQDVEAARSNGGNPDTAKISVRNGTILGVIATLHARAATGYRSGDYVNRRGTEYDLGVTLSGAFSPVESPFFAVKDTKMHPASSAAVPPRGAGLRAHAHMESWLNPAIASRLEVYMDRLASDGSNQYGQFGGRGLAWIEGKHVILGVAGFWNLLMGPDLVVGGHWNGGEFELGFKELGLFRLQAPPGHSLLSYQISSSIPKSRSKGVFQIMSLDGSFWEVNLAPTLTFSPALSTFIWYRFVSGKERAYRSSVSKEIQIKQEDFEAKNPDSQYESVLHDLSINLRYTPWRWGGFHAGLSASYFATRYKLFDIPPNPSSPTAQPFDYSLLLDRGRQNVTLLHVSALFQF